MILDFLKKHKFTIILILVILAILVYTGGRWYEEKMKLVNNGLADSKFPFREYTILELARNGSVTDYVPELEEAWKALPTRTTPRETFDMYIQALKDGDIERALECCVVKEDYMEYREDDPWRLVHYRISEEDREYLYKIKDQGRLGEWIRDLENIRLEIIDDIRKIEQGSTGELEVRYNYRCWIPENEPCHLFFTKDLWADWKLGGVRLF